MRRSAFGLYREEVPVGNLPPAGVSVEAFGGDHDGTREGFSSLDKVQGVAWPLRGVASKSHCFTVHYPEVQRGIDPELRAERRDELNGLGGRFGQRVRVSRTGLRVAQPIEEEGEDGLGVCHAKELRERGVAQG